MQDDAFKWDDDKAAVNMLKHGVSFKAARAVFADAFAIEFADNAKEFTEQRFVTLGIAEDHVLFMVYPFRKDRIRIISARGAEPRERWRYHDDNKA